MRQAKRIANLPPYFFAKLGQKIAKLKKEGMDIIRIDIGSPDLPPPDFILQELYRSAADPSHHSYAGYYGIPALRQAMADYYHNRLGIELDPDTEVLPLIGSKEGIAHVPTAFVNADDVVLVPDPGYPVYGTGTLLAGGEAHFMPLLEENKFLPMFEDINPGIAQKAKVMFLSYPNNPTSAVADEDLFKKAIDFATNNDIVICHDNPYAEITFDGYKAPSFLEFS